MMLLLLLLLLREDGGDCGGRVERANLALVLMQLQLLLSRSECETGLCYC